MSFLASEAELRTAKFSKERKLKKIDLLINWDKLGKLLSGKLNKKGMYPQGRKPYDFVQLLKAILLGQWFSLSDFQLEEALIFRLDFMLFTGFSDEVPDETTLCRFRNKLVEHNLWEEIFDEINGQLKSLGVQVETCEGAIVDATLIESACRPRRMIESEIPEDRREEENTPKDSSTKKEQDDNDQPPTLTTSKDKEAKWLKKGKKFHYGYKVYVHTDHEGYIQAAHTTPANGSETKELPHIARKVKKGQRLYGDKGYTSKANREFLRELGIKDGIMHKAVRGKPLSPWQKVMNKLISKSRFRVEQTFGTLKRMFHFWRSSYIGCDKVNAQFLMKSICLNLLKASNRVSIA